MAPAHKLRNVSVDVDETIVRQIEKRSRRKVEVIVKDFLVSWITDDRHTLFEAKQVGVAWPVDWYREMIRRWGVGGIAAKVREILFKDLSTAKNPLPEPPSPRDLDIVRRDRVVSPSTEDRATFVSHVILPQSYVDRLKEMYGDNKVSTGMKAHVWMAMKKEGVELVIPKGLSGILGKFQKKK